MLTKRCLSVVMVALLVQPQLLVCGVELNDLDQNEEQCQEAVASPSEANQGDNQPEAAQKGQSEVKKRAIQLEGKVNEDGSFNFSFITGNRRLDALIGLAAAVLVLAGYWKNLR